MENLRWWPTQMKCTYLSFQTRYSNTIPTAIPTLPGSGIQVGQVLTLYNQVEGTGSEPRWRYTQLKCIYLSSQTRQQRDSHGYTYVFWVLDSNGTSGIVVRPERNRKWNIQDGGLSTWNTYILQLVCKIATKFQRLYTCLRSRETRTLNRSTTTETAR